MSVDTRAWATNRRYRRDWPPSPEQLSLLRELRDRLGVLGEEPASRRQAAAMIAALIRERRTGG